MKNKKNNDIMTIEDWLEFKTSKYVTKEKMTYVNVRRSQISEVIAPYDSLYGARDWCTIKLMNGNTYEVNMPYEKVVELL